MAIATKFFKSVLGLDSGTSQQDQSVGNVGQQPLVLEASKVSVTSRSVIGSGSFATVHQGKYKGKNCAIKVFNNGIVRKDIENEQPFSIIQHHQNVVLVHGLWYGSAAARRSDNQPALVMELCDTSLQKYLQMKNDRSEVLQFHLHSKLEILRDVAAGMIYLHSLQIIHGNLTAINVLLNVNGLDVVAKIADFGLAWILDPNTIHRITTIQRKSDSMPPEVKDSQDQVELTGAVDVFSFGCLIPHVASCVYPATSGRHSYTHGGSSEFQKRVHYIHVHKHVFEPLMRRCLDERPSARGTFEDVMGDIQLHLNKYSKNKQAETLEEKQTEIERMKSDVLKHQGAYLDLKKEHAAMVVEFRQVQATVSQKEEDLKHLNSTVTELKQQLKQTATLKDSAEKERKRNETQAKKNLEKLETDLQTKDSSLSSVTKERDQLRSNAAAREKAVQSHQQKLKEAQEREQKLNADLRQYRDDLKAMQNARDKLQQSKETLEEEKVTLDKQVRKLTFKLEVRVEDLGKKEKEIVGLARDLEEAHKAIEEGNALEPVLRHRIEELEEDKKDVMDKLEKNVGKLKKLEKEMAEAKETQNALEEERDQKTKSIRELEGERDKQAYSIQELESALSEMTAHNEELKQQCDEEEASCQLKEKERSSAVKRAEDLQKQFNELHKDHDTFRKAHTVHLQEKTQFIQEMKQKKIHFRCLLVELEATKEDRDNTRKQLELLQASLHTASLELEGKCDRLESSTVKLESKLSALSAHNEELEGQCVEESEKCHLMEGKCERLACGLQELEAKLIEMTTHNETLRKQLDEEAEECHLITRERDSAFERMQELQRQRNELHGDHETLRKELSLDLQKKTDRIQELTESSHQTKAQLQVTSKERDTASLELLTLRKEKGGIEEQVEALSQHLKAIQEELDVSEETKLELSQRMEELQGEVERFEVSRQEMESNLCEVTALTEELQRQLCVEAENCHIMEGERNHAFERAEELQKQRDELHREHDKFRKQHLQDLQKKSEFIEDLVERERQNKEQLESTKQSLKAKEVEYFALENAQLDLLQHTEELQSEKQLFEAQLTQLGGQLEQMRVKATKAAEERNALRAQLRDFVVTKAENNSLKNEKAAMVRHWDGKGKELKEFEKQLNKKQSEFERHWNKKQLELSTERRLVAELKKKLDRELVNLQELLAQHSQQKINIDADDKQKEVEEALRLKEREIVLLQHQLNIAKQEGMQQKSDVLVAEGKAQESTVKIRMLAESYFQSHRYPPFLCQLHQTAIPSAGVTASTSKLCIAGKAEVSEIKDLRLFHPDASWSDELRSLLSELRALPDKDRQACALFSFLHCGGVITFYRFHVVLVPQVLSREPEIHTIELEGGVKPKAMLMYAQAQLGTKNLEKEFGISAQAKGILLSPRFEGDIPKLAMRLDDLVDIPHGLKDTESYLDAIMSHELRCRYKEFATPRIVPTVPPMGVAMAVI